MKKKGLVGDGGARGDLYVRLSVQMPNVAPGAKTLELKAPPAEDKPNLEREDIVELREGAAWRRWKARETPGKAQEKTNDKAEL